MMSWSMPRPVLRTVAAVLGVAALISFVMGILNAPQRSGRLPGERAPTGVAASTIAIDATEATPLSQDRIAGSPPPAKAEANAANTTEEQAADEADQPVAPSPATKTGDAAKAATGVVQSSPAKAADQLGNTLPPAEDEPPH